jgi:GT2 family glycosyltransferase
MTMRMNGTTPPATDEPAAGWGRVTSMARWLARRRQAAGAAPRISVVMPVYNAESTLAECLTRLCSSSFPDFEVVLVDDGSTDQTRVIAANFPVRVVPSPGRVGPAAARNVGAQAARGDILFFIDSDVMVRPDSVGRVAERLVGENVDGVVGVQAASMRYRDVVSQYKNIWMRWTYLRKTGDVPLFYTTAAAIRRDAFLRAGGFDVAYATPNVEDTAFGQKLARLGIRVRVAPELEVEHVKRYSLGALLRTDFMRAVSLTRLKLRERGEIAQNNTSVPTTYMASVPLAGLGAALVLVAATAGWPLLALAGLAVLGATAGLNHGFIAALRQTDGWTRAFAAIPLLWIELLVVGLGTAVGMASYAVGRRY